jgi:hypothetical protein
MAKSPKTGLHVGTAGGAGTVVRPRARLAWLVRATLVGTSFSGRVGRPSGGDRRSSLLAEEGEVELGDSFGSARKSISTIFPFSTVKAPTENGLPSRIETVPGAPLTRARRVVRPICDQ